MECPECGSDGKTVKPVTVQALLTGQQVMNGDWRFCDSTDCEVVYFSDDGRVFAKDQLTVPVGVKETTGERPLCYCFGHSVASIKEELQANGHSDALQDIRTKMRDPGCSCETMNPSGSCCLGSVAKGIETAKSELPVDKMGTIASVGTVLSAVMASSCCWLPLLLVAFGVSGAGIAATLETYRPLFVVVTAGFLGTAFYLTYRPKRVESCCETSGTCRPSAGRFSKVMLWIVTVLAVGFLFFPSYVGSMLADQSTVTEGMDQTVFQIEGMTCKGCATTVAHAIRQVDGVQAVTVDFAAKRAVVSTEPCCPVPDDDFIHAIEDAGFASGVVGAR